MRGRKVRASLAMVALCALAVLPGCGESESEPQTFEDPSTIDVAAGDEFEVALDANTSTGYEWELAAPLDEAVVTYSGSEYEADPDSEDLAGAGGTQTLSFQAEGAGEATIELRYVFAEGDGKEKAATERSIAVTVG